MIDDPDAFAQYYSNYLSDDGDVQFYEQQLKKDHRRNTIAGDLYQRYNDYKSYQDTQFARDVERTVSLLPQSGEEIAVKDLKNALVNQWYMDEKRADKVIKEVGTNDDRVSARNHAMSKNVEEIRLRKITS